MDSSFALFTSDPTLLLCELSRLDGRVSLSPGREANALGSGTSAPEHALVQRYPAHEAPNRPSELLVGPESEVVLFHAGTLPLGTSIDENTQPFRFRRWLFTHTGVVRGADRIRPQVRSELPDFLRRQLRGQTDGELAFGLFLAELRAMGRMEDRRLEARTAAELLGKAARRLEALSREAGEARTSTMSQVTSNGRVLVALRLGEQPLHYALLEGSEHCERCQLGDADPETHPRVEWHRRCRSVAVTTHPRQNGWIELPSGMALAVDARLQLEQLKI